MLHIRILEQNEILQVGPYHTALLKYNSNKDVAIVYRQRTVTRVTCKKILLLIGNGTYLKLSTRDPTSVRNIQVKFVSICSPVLERCPYGEVRM